MSSLVAILLMALITATFGGLLLMISSLLGPKSRLSAAKEMPYECGVPGQETEESKISVKFYLTAILFILFDIEIIFMYPWALRYMDFVNEGYGLYILAVMGVFIGLFVLGLIWEIKSRALDWNR